MIKKFILKGAMLFLLSVPGLAKAQVNAYIHIDPFSWFQPTYRVIKVDRRPIVRKQVTYKPFKKYRRHKPCKLKKYSRHKRKIRKAKRYHWY